MIMHEWNTHYKNTILLIHPMLSSAKDMKTIIADNMKNPCRYLIPDLSGHGDAQKDTYQNASEEAKQIHAWLKKNHITSLKLGYGASLGGVVLLQLLKYDDLTFEHLFFEGTSFYQKATFLEKVLRSVFLNKHQKAIGDPELCKQKMTSMFGERAAPVLADHFIHMKDESIIHIVHDCCDVDFPDLSEAMQKKCIFAYGEKDFDSRKAKKLIPKLYPSAKIETWSGYGHCEKLSKDPVRYTEILQEITEF